MMTAHHPHVQNLPLHSACVLVSLMDDGRRVLDGWNPIEWIIISSRDDFIHNLIMLRRSISASEELYSEQWKSHFPITISLEMFYIFLNFLIISSSVSVINIDFRYNFCFVSSSSCQTEADCLPVPSITLKCNRIKWQKKENKIGKREKLFRR